MSEETDFLSRWAERKRRVQNETEQLDEEKTESAETQLALHDEFEGKTDDEILSELQLPSPESLKLGDSVAGFMDSRVPERIRHKALRAFWRTNPVLANIDGLDEYCEDFTDAATVVDNLQTIYQVGKGYASQVLDVVESLADEDDDLDPSRTESLETQDQRIAYQATDEPAAAQESESSVAGDHSLESWPDSQPQIADESAEDRVTAPLLGRRMQFRS